MDGAMKFVKGDAIAGIIVLLTNIVGGLVIGTVQRGWTCHRGQDVHPSHHWRGLVSQILPWSFRRQPGLS